MGFFDKLFGKKKPEVKVDENFIEHGGNFEYVDLGNGTCRLKGRGENRDVCVTTVPAEIDGLKVVEVDSTTFDDYDDLCEVTILANITELVSATFADKAKLSKVTLPESLKIIGNEAFRECISLKGIVIPDSVTEIGASAFSGCTLLGEEDVVLPKSLKKIENSAFSECESLEGIVIPEGVTEIGDHAFAWCPLLGEEDIVLPKSLEKIEEFAFRACDKLEGIEIPEGVTEIGGHAFDECPNFKEIVLPRSIKKLGESVIGDYMISVKVVYNGTKAEWENVSKAEDWCWCQEDYTIYCTDGEITVNVDDE